MNKKGFSLIVIILIIVGVLAVAGGVYYYGFLNKKAEPVACTQEAKQCSDGSYVSRIGLNCEFAECSDITKDWQTYNNVSEKYSFKYPPEWNAATNKYNNKNALFGPNAGEDSGLGGVEFSEYAGTVDAFMKYMENNADIRYLSSQPVSIGGLDGRKVEYAGTAAKGSAALLKHGDEIINIYINSKNTADLDKFNQIISTFKFTK